MSDRLRHVFIIETLSKETLAMRDLAAYITDLAELLGSHESVHCQEIRDGSVEVVFDVEPPSMGLVIERMLDAREPAGDPTARIAYRNLSQRLKQDGASGVIVEQTEKAVRTLIEIPGVREGVKEKLPILWETGTVDGTPTGVGGRLLDPEWVPLRIVDSGIVVNCEARPPAAIEIAHHLLTASIRATGKGKWVHDDDKGWRLEKFRIQQFELLDSRPVAELVGEMRGLYAGTDWARMDDPIGRLLSEHNLDVEPGLLKPEKQQIVLQNRDEVTHARAAARQMSVEAPRRAQGSGTVT